MRLKVSILAVFFLCSHFVFSHQEVKTLSLSMDGIEKLEIDCGSGFLKVSGTESLKEIEVTAEIELKGRSEKNALEYIQKNVVLSLERKGNKAVLISKFKPARWLSFRSRSINLTVNVPKNINLNIDDGSGFIEIENIAGNVDIDDGSGSLDIQNILGDVNIDDGSGEIDAYNITGELYIDDGSGTITVKDIGGDVTVSDGSGSINIDGVEKNVLIKSDGSGSLRIQNVKGDVINLNYS